MITPIEAIIEEITKNEKMKCTHTNEVVLAKKQFKRKKFNSAKQFTSFLRLAPNNRVSGGKVNSSITPKGS